MEPENTTAEDASPVSKDLILELNFVPDWARKPPELNYFDRETGRDDSRRPSRSRDFSQKRPDSRDRRQDTRKPDRRRDDRRRDERPSMREPREWVEKPPISIRFLPQHKYLSEVIRRIRLSRRAHPLMQVAGLFVSNPGSCEVRMEYFHEEKDKYLFQCRVCGMVGLSEEAICRHVLQKHMDEFLVKEEKEVPAPAGTFKCVLQCGLSGVLIGPPNHHSTAERIREIRNTQYPRMSEEEYKSYLKTLHEPEKIEQWKEQNRKVVVYRKKTAAEGDKPMDWNTAEAYFRKEVAPAQCEKAKRVSLSGAVARNIEDMGLSMAIRDAWQNESRFPSSLIGSLRGAFHNKDLQLFKAGKGAIFVSDIKPSSLAPERAIPSIRDVLLYLKDHPGCTRENIVASLRPGSALDSKEATEILSPLTWLIERGHIIEFFDGTLSVIGGRTHTRQSGGEKTASPVKEAQASPSAEAAVDPVPVEKPGDA